MTMTADRPATRVTLVDVPPRLAEQLESALARIGARVVARVDGDDAVRGAEASRPGLLVVGPSADRDGQRARCRALRARITAPLVVLVVDGGGTAFTDEPAVDATLMTAVGIDAMVGQVPVVLARWAAWRRPRVAGPLRVDRADPAVELFGMVVKVPRSAADALAAYADRRRTERRASGPLPRLSRITGSLPRIRRRSDGPRAGRSPQAEVR